jgi:hypothetical protein
MRVLPRMRLRLHLSSGEAISLSLGPWATLWITCWTDIPPPTGSSTGIVHRHTWAVYHRSFSDAAFSLALAILIFFLNTPESKAQNHRWSRVGWGGSPESEPKMKLKRSQDKDQEWELDLYWIRISRLFQHARYYWLPLDVVSGNKPMSDDLETSIT